MPDFLKKLHHICIVVNDIDKSQAYYESIGVGPWEAYPPLVEYEDLEVPSVSGFMSMQYRICNLPNVQVQLCQPNDDPSPQRIHLNTKGEGVFHLGFEVPDADAAEGDATDRGLDILMRGRRPNGTGFTYYDTADKGAVTLLTRATDKPGK
ncbi:MAG: glyoxalase [Rhodobacteraceae bacterium]|nr:MAG: glyoxalase [Paracoccaceae bacterium]